MNRTANTLTRRSIALAALSVLLLQGQATCRPSPGPQVIGHKFTIQIFPGEGEYRCTDTLTLERHYESDPTILLLDPNTTIESLMGNGRSLEYSRRRDTLEIENSTDEVIIQFWSSTDNRSEFSRIARASAAVRTEEILPRPWKILSEYRASVVVPASWSVVAAGDLLGQTAEKDSARFVFETSVPVQAPGWIVGGEYTVHEYDQSGIRYRFLLLSDSADRVDGLLSLTNEAITFFSTRFSPYAFRSFSVVEVGDWVGGPAVAAAAFPSAMLVKTASLWADDAFSDVATVLPHELAHQWWPLSVFVPPEDLAFLSEGLCEYSAFMFREATERSSRRDSLSTHPLLRSLLSRAAEGKDQPLQGVRDLRTLPSQYLKAMYVHHMLRGTIGDSLYDTLLRAYARRYTRTMASTDEFRKLAEEVSGAKLGWFFTQWVNTAGIPRIKVYNVKCRATAVGWETTGRVRVVGYEKYSTPVDVGACSDSVLATTKLWLGTDSSGVYRNDVPFSMSTTLKPQRVVLDPEGDVLRIRNLPTMLGDLREPGSGVMIVGSGVDAPALRAQARADSAILSRVGWAISILSDTLSTLGDLQRQTVLLYGREDQNLVVQMNAGKFSYRIMEGSVIMGTSRIADSSLAMFQTIENPFRSRGMWCWIATTGTEAHPRLLPLRASWSLQRGEDVIDSGVWEVADPDVDVGIP